MKYDELLNELYSKRSKGIKLGLQRVQSLFNKLGNPQRNFKSIHIAGTNGKGSVSKIIYNLLKIHGFSVGLFTSPHLTRFTERIVVNDNEISEEIVTKLIELIKPYDEDLTFFEYVTAIAFLYFKEMKIDYAVVETGMGGRLDATNIIEPEISVITSIGFDHQQFLGNTLSAIAGEKAGIIKKDTPVVSSSQEVEAEEVIYRRAKSLNSNLFVYGKDFFSKNRNIDLEGVCFDFYPSPLHSPLEKLRLSLIGLHQIENASVALKTFMTLYPQWQESLVRKALENIKMPGRLEIFNKEPLVIFDIGHNPSAIKALVKSLKILTQKKPVVVLGIMQDKDILGVLKEFEKYARKIIFTVPNYERALKYEELLKRINGVSLEIQFLSDCFEAFKKALSLCNENNDLFLLCTGSSYLVGELKEALGEKSSLRKMGELL